MPNLFDNEQYYYLLIAALLHDIGKFWQRAGDKEIRNKVKKEYHWFLNEKEGAKHQFYSAYFLDKVIQIESSATIVLKHHRPESDLDYIVAISDKLSAIEREELTEGYRIFSAASEPLEAVVSRINNIKDNVAEPMVAYKPLTSLNIEGWEKGIPVKDKSIALEYGYSKLWANFVQEASNLFSRYKQNLSSNLYKDKFFTALYYLLYRYTTCIPSAAYYSRPTVPLFDHLRTTTAIAACIYHQGRNKKELERLEYLLRLRGLENIESSGEIQSILEKKDFLLVNGDLSGIQDFVYDITSKGAAKGLKGRSFYLSILVEIIAEILLRRAGLPLTNMLFCGGGHFLLLLPASSGKLLKDFIHQVNKILWQAHRGRLALVITELPISYLDFSKERFATCWDKVKSMSRQGKEQKFQEIMKKEYSNFFGPFWEGEHVCPVCGQGVQIEGEKCNFCNNFEEWGEELIKKPYLIKRYINGKSSIITANSHSGTEGIKFLTLKDVFSALGCQVEMSDEISSTDFVFSINNTAFLAGQEKIHGWILMPNHAPLDKEQRIKDFDHLAKTATGKEFWGVLRGDIDDLGKVFHKGLGSDCTISRAAALSREVSWFFTAVFNRIVAEFKDKAYVIYAGGDDFFVVGSWDCLPELAVQINDEFIRYMAENSHLTLSCAITIAPGAKYPLYLTAREAGNELDIKAKGERKTREGIIKKNALSFLGEAFSWQDFKWLREIKNLIVQLINEQKVARSLYPSLYAAYANWDKYEKGNYPLSRVWRLAYSLGQLAQRHNESAQEIMELERRILADNFTLQKGGLYAIRWAEFLTIERQGE